MSYKKKITARTIKVAQRAQKMLEATGHPRWTWEDWQRWSRAQSLLDARPMHLRPILLYGA